MGKKVLVAPLDWGLGHATRCIPLIEALLAKGVSVSLAGSGASLKLLREQYPEAPFLELPGYKVTYAKNNKQIGRLIRQLPRLSTVIRRERKVLANWVKENPQDGIISDNRYGCWHPHIASIFVCHQLNPLLPLSLTRFQGNLFRLHQKYLLPFQEIWVPDYPPPNSLSGKLSQPLPASPNTLYLGPLSRFCNYLPPTGEFTIPALRGKKPSALAILSGPEPQRSLLEQRILEQSKKGNHAIWIVQGKWDQNEIITQGDNTLIPHLHQHDLYIAIKAAQYLISRSGYSSLMDYEALGAKYCILIPTPGQTEQEYLGEKLHEDKVAFCTQQNKLDLTLAFQEVRRCKGFKQKSASNNLDLHLENWLKAL